MSQNPKYKKLRDLLKTDVQEIETLDVQQIITNREVLPLPKNKKRKNKEVFSDFWTFDIETTYLPTIRQSFMYVWQLYTGHVCIIGRTWKQFKDLMAIVAENANNVKQIIYVHNLAYEFMFLSGIYKFSDENVFAVEKRKVLKCTMLENIEFRCSYMLSNMGLDTYTQKYNVLHKKLTGSLDYAKIRTSKTELEIDELKYCVNDVVGLHECICEEMRVEGDTLYTIPLTSTGYVRRDAVKALEKYKRTLINKIAPNYKTYSLLRQAFRGGNVHASRFYAGAILKWVKSMDRSSSYPEVIENFKFPISPFKSIENPTSIEYYTQKGYACLARVVIEGLQLRDELWGAPYLPLDKVRGSIGAKLDNGRILSATILETTLTDVDYTILKEEYKWKNFKIVELEVSKYGSLPEEFKEVVREYYRKKTALKGDPAQKVLYEKMKNKLNSLYGMMAQCPVKQDILYCLGEWLAGSVNEEELLDEYNKRSYLVYQWGVWVTAWARKELEEGIKLAGHKFVYADTDSVKYIGELDNRRYNTEKIIVSQNNKAFATDSNGKTHYMGVYEDDGEYAEFITWGAKRYAYVDKEDNTLHITIAGVNKELGAKELKKKGGLKALKPGFIFKESKHHTALYNDQTYGWYMVDNTPVYITANMCLEEGDYKFTDGKGFKEYLDLLKASSYAVKHLQRNF